eukprot:scaffold6707_cov119-Isochrysis_galbana.AAC.2
MSRTGAGTGTCTVGCCCGCRGYRARWPRRGVGGRKAPHCAGAAPHGGAGRRRRACPGRRRACRRCCIGRGVEFGRTGTRSDPTTPPASARAGSRARRSSLRPAPRAPPGAGRPHLSQTPRPVRSCVPVRHWRATGRTTRGSARSSRPETAAGAEGATPGVQRWCDLGWSSAQTAGRCARPAAGLEGA